MRKKCCPAAAVVGVSISKVNSENSLHLSMALRVELICQGIQCTPLVPTVQRDQERFSSCRDVFLFVASVGESFKIADVPQTLLHFMQHGLLTLAEEY